MVVVPAKEAILFAKINLLDGFWPMLVWDTDKWNFAYVLPGVTSQPTRLVIPYALQMGWTKSPGYFCAATETGRVILQALIDAKVQLPPHQFDVIMTLASQARRQALSWPSRPWQMSAAYVDDYTFAAVESPDGTTLDRVGRTALLTVHGLFLPPEQSATKGAKILFP